MKLIITIFIFGIISVLFYSCGNVDCSTSDIDSYYLQEGGSYFFKMCDESGKPLAEGIMKIAVKKKLDLSGTYSLTIIHSDSTPGINSMKGLFGGKESEDDNTVLLNMNPKVSDNNVIFEFNLMKNKIEGKWYHSTYKGRVYTGKLEGLKIK